MARCRVDPSLERQKVGDFAFPLGVYPVEPMTPKPGYSVDFEPADGSEGDEDWEEWPDRYMFDVVITAERLEPLCRSLLGIFPGRVFPILDVLGQDAFREVDPYIAYDLVGMDRVADALRRFRGFFYEDGLVGWGVMCEEPFLYMFVDEHKIVTIRAEPALRDRVEKLLKAFDLEPREDPAGADAVSHEHRSVLVSEPGRTDLLMVDEIVEYLRDEWRLTLNVDPESNVDEQGRPLGVTAWRCLVRCFAPKSERPKYAEVLLSASCLREAEDRVLDLVDEIRGPQDPPWEESVVVQADRLDEPGLDELARSLAIIAPKPPLEPGIIWHGWLE